jgi:hypothetical protein
MTPHRTPNPAAGAKSPKSCSSRAGSPNVRSTWSATASAVSTTSQHRAMVDLGFLPEEETWQRPRPQRSASTSSTSPRRDFTREELDCGSRSRSSSTSAPCPSAPDGDAAVLAFSEPPRQADLASLRMLLNRRLKVVLTTPGAIHAGHQKPLRPRRGDRRAPPRGARIHRRASPDVVFDVQTSSSATPSPRWRPPSPTSSTRWSPTPSASAPRTSTSNPTTPPSACGTASTACCRPSPVPPGPP